MWCVSVLPELKIPYVILRRIECFKCLYVILSESWRQMSVCYTSGLCEWLTCHRLIENQRVTPTISTTLSTFFKLMSSLWPTFVLYENEIWKIYTLLAITRGTKEGVLRQHPCRFTFSNQWYLHQISNNFENQRQFQNLLVLRLLEHTTNITTDSV